MRVNHSRSHWPVEFAVRALVLAAPLVLCGCPVRDVRSGGTTTPAAASSAEPPSRALPDPSEEWSDDSRGGDSASKGGRSAGGLLDGILPPECEAGARAKVVAEFRAACLLSPSPGARCAALREEVKRLSNTCFASDIEPARLEWEHFIKSPGHPCQSIPAEWFNPDSASVADLLRHIAPRVVVDPGDGTPPASMEEVLELFHSVTPSVDEARIFVPYDAAVDRVARQPRPVDAPRCEGHMDGAACCGVVRAPKGQRPSAPPLYVDVREKELSPRDGISDRVKISAVFSTVHLAGSVMGITQVVGAHLFDAESVQLDYFGSASGRVALGAIKFSRHGSAVELFRGVCRDGRYRRFRDGAHPIVFQASGGHSMYLDATASGDGRSAMYTDSRLQQAVESGAQPVERMEKGADRGGLLPTTGEAVARIFAPDHTVRDLQDRYERSPCVLTNNPKVIRGVGSLWNAQGIGQGRSIPGIEPEKDLCIGYAPEPHARRSLRYLNGWLDEEPAELTRFGCGVAPGLAIGVRPGQKSAANDDD